MKRLQLAALTMVFLAAFALCKADPNAAAGKKAKPLPAQIKTFAAAKEHQARALAKKLKLEVSPDIWKFFAAVEEGNWAKATSQFDSLRQRSGQYQGSQRDPSVGSPIWQTIIETKIAAEYFALGEPKYATAFGEGIIESIPPGSIYFGGTDCGRGLVTGLCKSQEKGDPFFTLTQNALADGNYLIYLRQTYGERIHLPTKEDLQKSFDDYLAGAARRFEHDKRQPNEPRQIKPGENVTTQEGKMQVSGQVAVMAINGLLTRIIFDANPEQEFFVEESFPLDWMYPYLSPHGMILKINHKELASISPEMVAADQEYWKGRQTEMIGDWLKPETTVGEVCDFARKVFLKKSLSGFSGDPKFVKDDYACKGFSKLRSSVGGLYLWRAQRAKDPAEKERMHRAGDFAFRQALAFCPNSPEAVYRYVNLLVDSGRKGDALLVAQLAAELDPSNQNLAALVKQLKR